MGKRNLRTDAQLVAERYFHVHTKRCSFHPCEAQIEVWRTPGGKLMPMDRIRMPANEARALGVATQAPDEVFVLEPHFGSCLGIEERNAKRAAGESQEQEPAPEPT